MTFHLERGELFAKEKDWLIYLPARWRTRLTPPTVPALSAGKCGATLWWPWLTSPSVTPVSSPISAPSPALWTSWSTSWSAAGRTSGRRPLTCSETWPGRRTRPPSPSCPRARWWPSSWWQPSARPPGPCRTRRPGLVWSQARRRRVLWR